MKTLRHATAAIGLLAIVATAPLAEARACKRLNKTEGAIIGGVGGAVLGKVIAGGTTGTVLGAAAGAIAGHEIARKNHRKCRYR